jgi:hypothetical protein
MSSASIVPQRDWFLQTFIGVDNCCQQLLKKKHKRGRPPALSLSEYITCVLFRYQFRIKDWKHAWQILVTFHLNEFPRLPSYKNFLFGVHQTLPVICLLLQAVMRSAHRGSRYGIIDSTSLPVCQNRWITRSKLYKGIAGRGVSSLGWFYGFKAHVCLNQAGRLLGLRITPGNVDDRKPVKSLLKWFRGICLADAGYVSQPLKYELWQKGIHFMTSLKKSMKGLATFTQLEWLSKRTQIEGFFSVMKDKALLYTTQARSFRGFMTNVIASLFCYQFQTAIS